MTAASNEVVARGIMRRARVAQALRAIEEGTRLDDLTDDEIDTIIDAATDHRIAHSDPRPVAEGLREAIIAAITEADGRFGYSYRLTKMDETGEEHTLFMDGFEPAVFEDRADGYPVLEQRRNTLRTDAILAALATHSPAPMAGEGWHLQPVGDPVSLNECPPGPFEFNGSLGFKTEYGAAKWLPERDAFTVSHWPDPYVLDSGEAFWGGVSGQEARAALVVQPLAVAHPSTQEGSR